MYSGFLIQESLAKLLDIDNYDLIVEGGHRCAMLDKHQAARVIALYEKAISMAHRFSVPEGVQLAGEVLSSNMAGVGVIVSTFTDSDDFIDTLTSGEAKRTTVYAAIMKSGCGERFLHAEFYSFIAEEVANRKAGRIDPPPAVAAAPAAPAPEPAKKVLTLAEEISEELAGKFVAKVSTVEEDGRIVCIPTSLMTAISKECAFNLAKDLDSNVMIISSSTSDAATEKLKKKLFGNFTFIYISCMGDQRFNLVSQSITNQACLGTYVGSYFVRILTPNKPPLSEYDKTLMDSCTNIYFALKKDRHIYVPCGVPLGDRRSPLFYGRVFKEIGRRLGKKKVSTTELIKIDKQYFSEIENLEKEQYIDFAIANMNSYIDEMKDNINTSIRDIGSLQRELSEKIKMYNQYMAIVDGYDEEKHKAETKKRCMSDFEEVKKIPQISAVFVKDNSIHVFTNDIIVTDERDKKRRILGKFHIKLNILNGSFDPNNSIVIKNITHCLVGGFGSSQEAPHVFNGGHICHGNMSSTLVELYGKRDVYGLISAIIFFLEAANTSDSAGGHLNKWPEYIEPVKEVDETDNELVEALRKG